MSTLKVNKVQHNTTGFNNVVQFTDGGGTENGQLIKAWVVFQGSGTVSIDNSFNVSSITDNGTGNYTVNFTNAFPNANYVASGMSGNDGNTSAGRDLTRNDVWTTTAAKIRCTYYDSTSSNDPYISLMFIGG